MPHTNAPICQATAIPFKVLPLLLLLTVQIASAISPAIACLHDYYNYISQSEIDELVYEISSYRENSFDCLTYPQRIAFTKKAERGKANVSELELLAMSYDLVGKTAQARLCFRLLILLEERDGHCSVNLLRWKKRLLETTMQQYKSTISLSDQLLKENKLEDASGALLTASHLRESLPMQSRYPYTDISTRLDVLLKNLNKRRPTYLFMQYVPEKRFEASLGLADKAIKAHLYDLALSFTNSALETASRESNMTEVGDWRSRVNARLSQIAYEAPALRDKCRALQRPGHRN